MTQVASVRSASTLWIMLLTLASVATTLALKCATPFPALAALAAVHMRRSDGIALMLVAWGASQLVGFCLLDYPTTANTFGWGAAMGAAAVAGAVAAHAAAARLRSGLLVSLAASYVAAFVVFKVVTLLASLGLHGGGGAFAADVLVRQFARNAAILVGLLGIYQLLTAAGVPAVQCERVPA
ncbi:hypothetical protein ACBY01_12870 [Sphingomonas sp. ac-8]|uniref:hypothetical protein n=1 Tax=Sphingomonas sp. ac-8 TaxID=3242977 RepID=UPI003A7FE2F8